MRYVYRDATAIELLKEVLKLKLDDCDIIILSVGTNDTEISWQEKEDMSDERAREKVNRTIIEDIAEVIVNIG